MVVGFVIVVRVARDVRANGIDLAVRHIGGRGRALLVAVFVVKVLLVVDIDRGARLNDFLGAVEEPVAVGVVGRQVFPLGHERGDARIGDGLGVIRRSDPGARVAGRRGLLQLEGGVHDRRGAKARPLLEHVERGRGAVDEVGLVARARARGLRQPLAFLDAVGDRRIPVILGRGADCALLVIGEHNAHVDGLPVVEHVGIGIVARGHHFGDGVGIGRVAAHVLERDRNREAGRAVRAAFVIPLDRDRGRGDLVGGAISVEMHVGALFRHRRIIGNRRQREAVRGFVRPSNTREPLGDRDRDLALGVVVVVKDLMVAGARFAVGGRRVGAKFRVRRVRGGREGRDLGIARVCGQRVELVVHRVVGNRRLQDAVAVVLDMHLHEHGGSVVEDAVFHPDVEVALGLGGMLVVNVDVGRLIRHAHPGLGCAQLLVVPGIGHGSGRDLLGHLVVEVVDVVLVAIKRGIRVLEGLLVEVDRVEALGTAAVGSASAVDVDDDAVGGIRSAYGGAGLAHRVARRLKGLLGHRDNAVGVRRDNAPLGGGRAARGVAHYLIGPACVLGNPNLIGRASDGHGLLRHGLLVETRGRTHNRQAAGPVGLHLNRLDVHRVLVLAIPAAALAVGAGERLAHRDIGRAVGAVERGVDGSDALDVVGHGRRGVKLRTREERVVVLPRRLVVRAGIVGRIRLGGSHGRGLLGIGHVRHVELLGVAGKVGVALKDAVGVVLACRGIVRRQVPEDVDQVIVFGRAAEGVGVRNLPASR